MIPLRSTCRFVAFGAALAIQTAFGQDVPARSAGEDVNGPEVRRRQGLVPGDRLLFNGWGITPAGEHVRTSDMVLKMVVAPDQKRLVAVSGGYNEHGLTLIDMARKQVTQFF